MKKINSLLSALQHHIPEQAYADPKVSKGSVGWHIEHSLLTLNLVMQVLKKSNPADYKPTYDWRRWVVLWLGFIPRGKIKAPKMVKPADTFNADTLHQHLLQAQQNLAGMQNLSSDHYFTHPFLGDFKLKPALRFLSVHTQHHLNIIHDILKNKQEL